MLKGDGGDGWVTADFKEASPSIQFFPKVKTSKGDGVTAVCPTYARVKKSLYYFYAFFLTRFIEYIGVTPSPFVIFSFTIGRLRGDGQKKVAVTSRHLLPLLGDLSFKNQKDKQCRVLSPFLIGGTR